MMNQMKKLENKKRFHDKFSAGLNKVQHVIKWKNIPLVGGEFNKVRILRDRLLTNYELTSIHNHDRNFKTDLVDQLTNKLVERNTRPMRFASPLKNNRVKLNNTFTGNKELEELNITKQYYQFKPNTTTNKFKHTANLSLRQNTTQSSVSGSQYHSPRCFTDYESNLEFKMSKLNSMYDKFENSYEMQRRYKKYFDKSWIPPQEPQVDQNLEDEFLDENMFCDLMEEDYDYLKEELLDQVEELASYPDHGDRHERMSVSSKDHQRHTRDKQSNRSHDPRRNSITSKISRHEQDYTKQTQELENEPIK